MWKPMLATLTESAPNQKNWMYEVKYDGFRCGLEWKQNDIKIWSRNGNDLTASFPEIVKWCQVHQERIVEQLPLFIDGEIVVLRTAFQSIFSLVQQRGRLKSKDKINRISQLRPASIICFDLVNVRGESLVEKTFQYRRNKLENLFQVLQNEAFNRYEQRLHLIDSFKTIKEVQNVVTLHQSEGIIAKQKNANYSIGKRSDKWLKIKNYRVIQGLIAGWNTNNDYFDIVSRNNDQLVPLGKVKNGFQDQEKETLQTFIQENGKKVNGFSWSVSPSVAIDINCLDAENEEIREAFFHQFRFDLDPEECMIEQVRLGLAQLPEEIEISKPKKSLFPEVSKQDYVLYLRQVAPLLIPKLKNKRLTMIRYPDGIEKHSFYQKHLPDYAPKFIQTVEGVDGNADILCNDLRSLLWFGNHGSLEFHIPFHSINSTYPDEIVFDLDPPTLEEFHLAVKAAHLIKEMVEHQGFIPFVKTSGKTGLQIHIPLEQESMTFDRTREFMEAVAKILVEKYPDSFTIERLKKNRGKRLYIDYVQHAPGKTIVAAYSPRATKEATVATPLYWDEVNEQLDPKAFTIKTIPTRLIEKGCPLYYL
ncbi:bifunctional non-homologous end joining protein LigD [Paraliobacillus quinghaiensis]|uniref:Bifunctional non-homologous end joining protein LigD n=1 Tax=Paraliobacillus quinghaiensis TaxID=470815 RepID=A0A917WSV7_9BACI|nr:DNA ligase D [Paraliobacillus quinghaiensis]GGM26425.1 bifunctional non-homologous end joining protein LigD [Paraliobacillus quinghaiensis]